MVARHPPKPGFGPAPSSVHQGKMTEKPWLSCRIRLALVGFLAFCQVYALRMNISVAIVCMTTPPDSGALSHSAQAEFAWERRLQGYILSAFFYGYLVIQIPAGWLAVRHGGKHVLGTGLLLAGISTLLAPWLARTHYLLLIGQRVFVGMTTGVVFPCGHTLWGKWAPPMERTKLTTLCYSGAPIGIIVTTAVSGLLCDHGFAGGWPSIFYLTGVSAIIWWLLWMKTAYSSPAQHPHISAEEQQYIESSIGHKKTEALQIPWLAILTSRPALAIFVCHFCANWGIYTTVTGMPMYMADVLKLSMSEGGMFSAVPAILGTGCGLLAAWTVDALRKRRIWTTGAARKWMQAIGTFPPAALLLLASTLDHNNKGWVLVLMGIASVFGSARGSSYNVNHVDIAPRFAGVLYGISNTLGTVSGMIAPTIIGELTPNRSREEWQLVFVIASVVSCAGALVFILFASGEEQPWARQPTDSLNTSQSQHLIKVI